MIIIIIIVKTILINDEEWFYCNYISYGISLYRYKRQINWVLNGSVQA
jgi:hypothetical protein